MISGTDNGSVVSYKSETSVPKIPGRFHGPLLFNIRAPPAGARVGLPGTEGATERRLPHIPSGDRRLHRRSIQFPQVSIHNCRRFSNRCDAAR